MKRQVLADEEVEQAVTAGFIATMVDVGDPREAEAMQQYGVRGTPTTIITDPQGKVLARHLGRLGKTEFLGLLTASDS